MKNNFICIIITTLFVNCATTELKDSDKKTSLYRASEVGQLETVQRLLSDGDERSCSFTITLLCKIFKNVNVNSLNTDISITPLHVASGKGHADIAKLLIDNGANINSNSGKYNFTPLHLAASQGKLETVLVLLDKGCDKNLVHSENGWTALHHASAYRYSEIVSILISKGANKTIKDCLSSAINGISER
jgi:ankyrin repeat protein